MLQGRADAALLDSYEPERIGFARTLVATTDRVFTPMVAEGLRGEFTRRVLAPLLATVATHFAPGRHALFRTLSQTRIHYADSPLSEGQAGHVHGGDRLPWVSRGGEDNFAPLRSLDWQVHVYGRADRDLERACRGLGLPLHIFAWRDEAHEAGLERDAVYLVRPDDYVIASAAASCSPVETIETGISRPSGRCESTHGIPSRHSRPRDWCQCIRPIVA